MTRPTWAEISRGNLLANHSYLRGLTKPGTELLAVVKANAYGHGLEHCAPLLAAAGAQWLGVTSVEEGVRARSLCGLAEVVPRILVMSGVWRGEAEAVLEHRLTPVVWEDYHLDLLESAAQKHGLGAQSVGVHLELDTGMSRQGVQAPVTVTNAVWNGSEARLSALLLRFHASSPLRLEGVMTHFSAPEDTASNATADELGRLHAALDLVIACGLTPPWLHAGNSATLIAGREPEMTSLRLLAERAGARLMLRPGLALYGYAPRFLPHDAEWEIAAENACKPVLSWKTRIISMRTLASGQAIGYNSTFRAARASRVALLPVGYADGLNRLLSNRGHVLVHGAPAPIAGRISMDQTVIDVTDIAAVEIGDEVVILGSQNGASRHGGSNSDGTARSGSITAYDHADLVGTIPWEILCDIGVRVPRVPGE